MEDYEGDAGERYINVIAYLGDRIREHAAEIRERFEAALKHPEPKKPKA
jgi:hypothetical protein